MSSLVIYLSNRKAKKAGFGLLKIFLKARGSRLLFFILYCKKKKLFDACSMPNNCKPPVLMPMRTPSFCIFFIICFYTRSYRHSLFHSSCCWWWKNKNKIEFARPKLIYICIYLSFCRTYFCLKKNKSFTSNYYDEKMRLQMVFIPLYEIKIISYSS